MGEILVVPCVKQSEGSQMGSGVRSLRFGLDLDFWVGLSERW